MTVSTVNKEDIKSKEETMMREKIKINGETETEIKEKIKTKEETKTEDNVPIREIDIVKDPAGMIKTIKSIDMTPTAWRDKDKSSAPDLKKKGNAHHKEQ